MYSTDCVIHSSKIFIPYTASMLIFTVCDFICLPFCKLLQSLTFVEFSEQLFCASFPSVTVAGSKYCTSKREMVIMEAVFF